MSCGCNGPGDIRSWNDFNNTPPQDPRDLISFAGLNMGGSMAGTWAVSANYAKTLGASPWITSPFSILGENVVTTNGTDNIQNVSDATQWNFLNLTVNSSSFLTPPLRKLVFMRAGIGWLNTLPITLSAATFNELQLSFLDNAATRGDAQGTIPVFRWIGPLTGAGSLELILKRPGRFTFGFLGIDNAGPANYSMFELDIIVV